MNKFLVVCCMACFAIGFFFGRGTVEKKETVHHVEGKTIRDTITHLVCDTVYLAGELKYKYIYKTDTIFKDIPVVDREATLAETLRDWNLTRVYKKTLFDDEHGKFSIDLLLKYNKLQQLDYSFTPVHKEIKITKNDIFTPFVSVSMLTLNSFSIGGGFFYHNLGCRVEWAPVGLNWGIMYKF